MLVPIKNTEPVVFNDPVISRLPVIKADPVNGNAAPPPPFKANDAVKAYDADVALDDVNACDEL